MLRGIYHLGADDVDGWQEGAIDDTGVPEETANNLLNVGDFSGSEGVKTRWAQQTVALSMDATGYRRLATWPAPGIRDG